MNFVANVVLEIQLTTLLPLFSWFGQVFFFSSFYPTCGKGPEWLQKYSKQHILYQTTYIIYALLLLNSIGLIDLERKINDPKTGIE